MIEPPKNIRLIYYYHNHLKSKNIHLNVNLSNKGQILNEINNYICSTPKETQKIISEDIKNNGQLNIIGIEKLAWLNNEKLCCYAWNFLNPSTAFQQQQTFTNTAFPINYCQVLPKSTPISHDERYYLLIDFFDAWNANADIKFGLMEFIKNEYKTASERKDPFKWLTEDDSTLCDWTWEYLSKSKINTRIDSTPINNKEKYLYIYIAFYLWLANEKEVELFSIKISKAISQIKFRRKIKEKKAINTYVNKDIKIKLDRLCKAQNKKINEILEQLITSEYEKNKK